MNKLLVAIMASAFFLVGNPVQARYYEPSTGRFLQEDPIMLPMPEFANPPSVPSSQLFSNSQSLNLYSYVGNRPFYYTDPFGLYWYDDAGDVSAGFGDVVSLGLTKNIRDILSDYYDMSDSVDPCSGYYTAGKWSGYAWWLTVSGTNNSNRYLRWGWGKYKGKPNFRIAGDWLKWKKNPHINLWPPKYWSR